MDRLLRSEKLRHAFLGALTACSLVLTILLSVSLHDRGLEERIVNRIVAEMHAANDMKISKSVDGLTAVAKPIYEWLENGKNGVRDTQNSK